MPSLIVTLQGAELRCSGGQVLVEHSGQVIQRLPQEQVERVLLLGRIGLSSGFLEFAFRRAVPVTFLTQDGGFKGRLDPGDRRDVALRLAQYRGLDDLPWRLGVAQELVRGKILAQRQVLMRCHRNHPQPDLHTAAVSLRRLLQDAARATTLPSLMGVEGNAARVYFRALPAALRRPLAFNGRSRRPPKDPVNALLSLGYGLLTTEAVGALAGVGLDPQIGIFHSSRGRMPALAQDLLELFRAPVADTLALSLINLGVVRQEHFEATEDGGVSLVKEALARYCREYRRRMQASFRSRQGETTSFRRELQRQAAHLRRVVLREAAFQPFSPPGGGPDRPGEPMPPQPPSPTPR